MVVLLVRVLYVKSWRLPFFYNMMLIHDTIALYRDESRPFVYRDLHTNRRPSIDIYSCSGKLINRINVGSSILA